MTGQTPGTNDGGHLATIYSVDPANAAALEKLESRQDAPNGAAVDADANGAPSTDLEAGHNAAKPQEEPPERSTLKITLIMLSLCVSRLPPPTCSFQKTFGY